MKESVYSKSIADTLNKFLTEEGRHPSFDEAHVSEENTETMTTRLAARFGVNESNLQSDEKMLTAAEEPNVKTDFFKTKGGAA